MNVINKFTVVYSFKIIAGKENDFIDAWTALTKLIYQFAGSYGSRLHKVDKDFFIAYAQWPDKVTWDLSGDKLPEIASEIRKQMRQCCLEIKTEYEMTVVEDFLKDQQYLENEIKSSQ
jgi:hypothetical protein